MSQMLTQRVRFIRLVRRLVVCNHVQARTHRMCVTLRSGGPQDARGATLTVRNRYTVAGLRVVTRCCGYILAYKNNVQIDCLILGRINRSREQVSRAAAAAGAPSAPRLAHINRETVSIVPCRLRRFVATLAVNDLCCLGRKQRTFAAIV